MADRRRRGLAAAALLFGAMSCSGASTSGNGPGSPPALAPAADPFYAAPTGIASLPPGSVIRTRPAAVSSAGIPAVATARTVLFASTDVRGQHIAASATVFTPRQAWQGDGSRPLVSVQPAYDSLGSQCMPSYAMQRSTTNPALDLQLVHNLLSVGWEVVIPDYEGPHSLFGVGPQEGRIVLDGVLATEALHAGGGNTGNRVGLWGYSGGGLATAWAGELQPSYARSLSLVGVAEGGVPADIKATLEHLDGGPNAGLELMTLEGIARAYPAAGVHAALTAEGRSTFAGLADACASGALLQRLAGLRLDSLTSGPALLDRAPLARVLTALRLGRHAPDAPVFNYHGVRDEVVPYEPDRLVVDFYCNSGTTVDAVSYPQGSHVDVAYRGTVAAMSWLRDRFAGIASPDTC